MPIPATTACGDINGTIRRIRIAIEMDIPELTMLLIKTLQHDHARSSICTIGRSDWLPTKVGRTLIEL